MLAAGGWGGAEFVGGRPALGPRAFGWLDVALVATREPVVGPVWVKPEMPKGPVIEPPAAASLAGGALAGKVVYLTGGHGLNATAGVDGTWRTDRGLTNGLVEDFGNQDQLQPFADYILRAGGMVAALRPIGHQPIEIVLDNDSPGVAWGGSWTNVTTGLHYDEDYGATPDAVRFRFASTNPATETAWAMYSPTFSTAGFYPVYTWVTSGSNRALQSYTVMHSDGQTEVQVDHRLVGRGWVYLGTYHFDQGAGQGVKISNRSPSGTIVVADAIRFGNGMGDWDPGTGLSGRTREDEAGLYWILRSLGTGGDSSRQPSAYLTGSTDANSNITAQPRFAADMNSAPLGSGLYLSFHSNAGGGRGAIALIHSTNPTPNQSRLALVIGRELNEDLRAIEDQLGISWSTRTTYTLAGAYGEINRSNLGSALDGTIVEVAFHDDATDALALRSPLGRDLMARATYHAVVRYFAEFGGAPLQFAPSSPTGLRTRVDSAGNIRLDWNPPPADSFSSGLNTNTGPNGFAATGYEVQVSRNGLGFETLATVTATTYTLSAAGLDDAPYYFRVVATNDGGRSAPSGVSGARKNGVGGGTAGSRVLIVSGFARFDQGLSPTETGSITFNPPSTGTLINYTRVRARASNSFDYVVQAGQAVAAYNLGGVALGFDSAWSGEVASGAVNLGQYHTVIWLSGEESTFHETFNVAEQAAVKAYVAGGGRFFVSGSEIGWDLDRPSGPTAGDRAFYNGTLRTRYVADSANTYTVTGLAGGIFAGLGNISFDSRDTLYNAEFADVIAPATGSGATVAMNYVGGTGGDAAVVWSGTGAGGRVVNFGFPFEAIRTAGDRAAVMGRVLDFFQTALPVDTQPPVVTGVVVNDGSSQRSGVRRLVVTFNEQVTPGANAFVLVRRGDGGGGAWMPGVTAANPSGDGRTWELTFSGPGTGAGGGLVDGVWDLTVVGSAVVDGAGNAMAGSVTTTFHRLFGDLNGDRTVNGMDATLFNPFFGSTAAGSGIAFAWWADFDGNGAVNNADLLQLRSRLGVLYEY